MGEQKDSSEETVKEIAPGQMFGSSLWGDRTPNPNVRRISGLDIPGASVRQAEILEVPEEEKL